MLDCPPCIHDNIVECHHEIQKESQDLKQKSFHEKNFYFIGPHDGLSILYFIVKEKQ